MLHNTMRIHTIYTHILSTEYIPNIHTISAEYPQKKYIVCTQCPQGNPMVPAEKINKNHPQNGFRTPTE